MAKKRSLVDADGNHQCSVCRVFKPAKSFYLKKSRWNGRNSTCKVCQQKKDAASAPLRRDAWLHRRYNLPRSVYDQMLANQGNVCAICDTPTPGTKGSGQTFHVDHDHETGHVRGLLCGSCNRALGLMKDKPAVLRAAATYLEQSIPGQ